VPQGLSGPRRSRLGEIGQAELAERTQREAGDPQFSRTSRDVTSGRVRRRKRESGGDSMGGLMGLIVSLDWGQ